MAIDVGVRGNTSKFLQLIYKILAGTSNTPSYLKWGIAIFIVGSLGYIKDLRDIDIAFLILVFIIMLDKTSTLENLINAMNEIK
ncbi:MAG: hypothetical protein QXV17_07580 [Candidatus Micrarchaeaceae archaeon]